uniref:Uncharacterized protein n=1 Tax=Candidatus Kentrum sp. TC TaxID=2126339 RepID=A0A450YSF4_9GAMM|nr:MAG: hypothetical protein BECKTC1821E_GA0114239_103513 [Candidatus Kentron sp. TC]VFK58012.1 MAG: hypothetical protein BECKTC1821F_GA0114240_102130 [Candidatus Kentron sp. TC]
MRLVNPLDESELTMEKHGKMLRKEILNDIPTNDLSSVIADFESEGATVSTEQKRNGRWSLTAIFEYYPK